jgi:hypothetical protein
MAHSMCSFVLSSHFKISVSKKTESDGKKKKKRKDVCKQGNL